MKTVLEQNDFACMAETIRRRYTRLARELGAGRPMPGDAVDDASRDGDGVAEGDLSGAAADADAGGLEAPWVPRPPAGPRLPDLILIDGGKGQLNAACAELAKLGLDGIPVIGLAKEYEEIHRPGEPDPLRLGLDSGAVKLLQRVRDEAHRFANTYNAQLRLRKISESLLDEFPGIGDARKQALLRKFGSVQRLRLASAEQIAEVPGFGGKIAVELKAFLEARRG
jgi:excinuclease ABC subunit C